MNAADIKEVLKLVTNNETAEDREAALRKAASLLRKHLAAARLREKGGRKMGTSH